MTTIGFIGLGIMGKPMVKNLVAAGHTVRAYAPSTSSVEAAVADGAHGATSVADAIDGADVVITMVPDSPQVLDVVEGPGGLLENAREGLVFVDMSTIRPDVSVRIA